MPTRIKRLLCPALVLLCACAHEAREQEPPALADGAVAPNTAPAADAAPAQAGEPSVSVGAPTQIMTSRASDAALEASAPVQPEAGAPTPAPALADAGTAGACPNKYSVATRMRVDMSWPDTVGYWGGQGSMLVWSKVTYTRGEAGTTTESAPCGVDLPVVTSTPLLDGAQFANDIPVSAFDQASCSRPCSSCHSRACWPRSTKRGLDD